QTERAHPGERRAPLRLPAAPALGRGGGELRGAGRGEGELKVGSLFSGVGGFDMGLKAAGMRVVWQVEIDPQARAVLRKHWPNVDLHEDVRNVGSANLAPVDLICGGFPCQDLSV